ncbi:MAG: hypothetical protein ACYCPS_01480 [Candidatus Saccharimonadales bacterium]
MARVQVWFRPLRNSYIASNYKGALSYIPYIAYLSVSAYIPLYNLQSKVVAVFVVIPNWIVATMIMTMFAKKRST